MSIKPKQLMEKDMSFDTSYMRVNLAWIDFEMKPN